MPLKRACVMYIRTSSAANVGDDKDSEQRQIDRCAAYAKASNMVNNAIFRDPAVSGTDTLIARPGFANLVRYCTQRGIQHILVEAGDRFARDLVVQETDGDDESLFSRRKVFTKPRFSKIAVYHSLSNGPGAYAPGPTTHCH